MRQTNEMWEMESTAPAHCQSVRILLPSWITSIILFGGNQRLDIALGLLSRSMIRQNTSLVFLVFRVIVNLFVCLLFFL